MERKLGDKIIEIYSELFYKVEYTPNLREDGSCYWVDYHVYEIVSLDEYNRPEEIDEESVFDGFVKWDGCHEFSSEGIHVCGWYGMQKVHNLFREIYKKVAELCNEEFRDLR